jgi:uncharacterized protein (DUF488 family)
MEPVLTVGHSTHHLDGFVGLIRGAGVELVADVRRFPGSRRLPHVAARELARSLPAAGVAYRHLPALGGRRRARADSPNGGWRNASFRGYADHMATEEFVLGLAELEDTARAARTAVMCAEALWWRCHRRLVADALVARGRVVRHLGPDGRETEHELTPFARVEGARVTYPGEAGQEALDIRGGSTG